MRRALVATLLVLIAIVLAPIGFWFVLNAGLGNPPIQFADGSSVQLKEVTYGTNHVHGTMLARILSRFPAALSKPILKYLPNGGRLNNRTTSQPAIILWMEYTGTAGGSGSSKQAMLCPQGGILAGQETYMGLYLSPGTSTKTVDAEFQVWPRRSKFIECVIQEYSSTGRYMEIGRFRFRNPALSVVAGWTPDTLPASKNTGDLQVRLLDFVTGHGSKSQSRAPDGTWQRSFSIHDENDAAAFVHVAFNSPRGTNETWQMFDADLSDATGNQINASSRSGMSTDMTFDPILWPNESAWKLNLHLKRKAGFSPEELVAFTNILVPKVGATNILDQTNSAMGIEAVLKWVVHRPELTNHSSYSGHDLSCVRVDHPQLGESNQLDLVRVIAQPANTNLNSSGSSWNDDYHEFSLMSIPPGTTHLDLTFSIQPTRHVEFMVAPNFVTNDYELHSQSD